MEQVPEAFFRVYEGVCDRRPNFEPEFGQHFILQNWWAWSCWKVRETLFQNIYGLLFAILHRKKVTARNTNLSKVHFFHILSAHAKGLTRMGGVIPSDMVGKLIREWPIKCSFPPGVFRNQFEWRRPCRAQTNPVILLIYTSQQCRQ